MALESYERYLNQNQNIGKDTEKHTIKLPDFSTMPKAGEYVKVRLPWCNREMIARVSTTGLNWIWENQKNDDFWCNEYIKSYYYANLGVLMKYLDATKKFPPTV